MGEEFNTEQFIQNLWERENLQGIMSVFNNRIKKERGNPNSISNDVRMG